MVAKTRNVTTSGDVLTINFNKINVKLFNVANNKSCHQANKELVFLYKWPVV